MSFSSPLTALLPFNSGSLTLSQRLLFAFISLSLLPLVPLLPFNCGCPAPFKSGLLLPFKNAPPSP